MSSAVVSTNAAATSARRRRQVVLGVCVMSKKLNSDPMRQILQRLGSFPEIVVLPFPQETIVNEPVAQWPVCDVFISFFSTGFPLEKAIEYTNLRKPYLINDIASQELLLDRRKMYDMLRKHNIPTPRYVCMSRDAEVQPSIVIEEDAVQVKDQRFERPFVEKPVSGEDHNIIIYFPRAAGGGSQHLFRKKGDRSSEFVPDHHLIRTEGSFIYEEFLPTQGTDVKVYTVGPSYFHAEARKAPVVDGKVNRNEEGKEIRYPIALTAEEKEIALKITVAFRQTVCGFDLLRANGKSYVCDVNGWSFVKNSAKYFDDCAHILREIMLRSVAPRLLRRNPIFGPVARDPNDESDLEEEDTPLTADPARRTPVEELRSVIAIIRHGDRTPKQKMKMNVTNEKILSFLNGFGCDPRKEVKLKSAADLQKLLDITRALLKQSANDEDGSDAEDDRDKFWQMKAVLERGGHFSGINRKVQLKPLSWRSISGTQLASEGKGGIVPAALAGAPQTEVCTEALLVLKWGGELTDTGRSQAQELGHRFRMDMYPGLDGVLRLHSTYRHDLKIYASDEGRVQMTAAAFAKGFLDLEGELTPILVSLVVKDKDAYTLLAEMSAADNVMNQGRNTLVDLMTADQLITLENIKKYAPTMAPPLIKSLTEANNPVVALQRLHTLFSEVTEDLRHRVVSNSSRDLDDPVLYHGETLSLMLRRYQKLDKDLFNRKKNKFDISKIPDVYDCVKYDAIHNQSVLALKSLPELYDKAKILADFVVPQEYGMTAMEKRNVGIRICSNLTRKIMNDLITASGRGRGDDFAEQLYRLDPRYTQALKIKSPGRNVRTRLYFTSESHIHSLLNILKYGGDNRPPLLDLTQVENASELDYLTTIVFRMYERSDVGPEDINRFQVSMSFSPGSADHPLVEIASRIPLWSFEEYVRAALDNSEPQSRRNSFSGSGTPSGPGSSANDLYSPINVLSPQGSHRNLTMTFSPTNVRGFS